MNAPVTFRTRTPVQVRVDLHLDHVGFKVGGTLNPKPYNPETMGFGSNVFGIEAAAGPSARAFLEGRAGKLADPIP